jgi:hypothetical protein
MDEMMFLFGLQPLQPQKSSLPKPLLLQQGAASCIGRGISPHIQHINQVLLRRITLLGHILLQPREDSLSLGERLAAPFLHVFQLSARPPGLGIGSGEPWFCDRIILQLFSKNHGGLRG